MKLETTTTDPIYHLIGNKKDLEDNRQVTHEDVKVFHAFGFLSSEKFISEADVDIPLFTEVSSKTGESVSEAVGTLISAIIAKWTK